MLNFTFICLIFIIFYSLNNNKFIKDRQILIIPKTYPIHLLVQSMQRKPQQSAYYRTVTKITDYKSSKKASEQLQTRPSYTNTKPKPEPTVTKLKNYLINPRHSVDISSANSSYEWMNYSNYESKNIIEAKLKQNESKNSLHSSRYIAIQPNPKRLKCMTVYNSPSSKNLTGKNEIKAEELDKRWREMKDEDAHDFYRKTEKKTVQRSMTTNFQHDEDPMDAVKTERTEKFLGMRKRNVTEIQEDPIDYSSLQAANFKKPAKNDQKPLPYLKGQQTSVNKIEPIIQTRAQIPNKKPLNKEAYQDMQIKLLSCQEYMNQCQGQIKELKDESSRKSKEITQLRLKVQEQKTRSQILIQQSQHHKQQVKKLTEQNDQLKQANALNQRYYERFFQLQKLNKHIQDLENQLSILKNKIKLYEHCIDSNLIRTNEFFEKQQNLKTTIELLENQLRINEEKSLKEIKELRKRVEKTQKDLKLTDLNNETRLRLRKEVEEDFRNQVEYCHQTKRENEHLKDKLTMAEKEKQIIRVKSLQRGKTKDKK